MSNRKRSKAKAGPASLSERAYLLIRDAILRGELSIGSPISRRKLAGQLQMSLLPVSEALQRLEMEGLVETRDRAGTRVRIPTRVDIEEHYVVREALECQSARRVASKASLQQFQELRRMAEQVDILFDRSAQLENDTQFLFAVNSHHVQLHMRIAEYAACSALKDAIEKNQVLIFNWLYTLPGPPRKLPHNFHRDLVDVLARSDPNQADRAMRAHILYGLEELLHRYEPRHSKKWRELANLTPAPARAAGRSRLRSLALASR